MIGSRFGEGERLFDGEASPDALAGHFRQLVETLPAAAYVCDRDGLIVYYNPKAVEIWGREPRCNEPEDRFCGSFRLYRSSGDAVVHSECWMALALRHDRSYEGCEIVIEQPSGKRVAALAYASPIHDEQGQLLGAVNVLVDISERKRMEAALERSEMELADFFDNASIGMHCVNADGIIVRANEAELSMLGYRRDEYVGRHIADFHADREVIEDILERLMAGETLNDYEAKLICKDGSTKSVAISSNVMWEGGEFSHTRCLTRDITSQRVAENALRAADQRKDAFIAMLGHELRNPLAPILSSVDYLERVGPAEPHLQKARDIIARQTRHMRRLIDDLLDIGRVTRGQLSLRLEPVSLESLVHSAIETVSSLIDARQHELAVRLPNDLRPFLGDSVRLSQVLQNLLVNAAKYTPPGGKIEVLGQQVPGDGRQWLEISVRDSGIGIDTKQAPRIFDMFTQLGREDDEPNQGLGVGLTLVQAILEGHGGSARVESEGVGRGSTFIARLPLNFVKEPVQPAPESPLPAVSQVPLRVLVVDDHRDSCDALAALLELDGKVVETASDAATSLEVASRFEPELVLLDIGLPDFNGYEVCRRMRATSWGAAAKIVAVTGWGQEKDQRKAEDAGFDRHCTKPVELSLLREIVNAAESGPRS